MIPQPCCYLQAASSPLGLHELFLKRPYGGSDYDKSSTTKGGSGERTMRISLFMFLVLDMNLQLLRPNPISFICRILPMYTVPLYSIQYQDIPSPPPPLLQSQQWYNLSFAARTQPAHQLICCGCKSQAEELQCSVNPWAARGHASSSISIRYLLYTVVYFGKKFAK